MNYSTDFPTIKDEVSPEEWQARLELLLDAEQKKSDYPPYWH